MAHIPTENQLRQILATILASATGKAEAIWIAKLGTVRPVAPTANGRSNWKLTDTTGAVADTQAIQKAVDLVRTEHPYVAW